MTAATAVPTVRERPILFSAPMVRAILDGRKTQTRRIFWQAAGPSLDIDVDEQLGVAALSWLHGPGPGHEVQERTARHACPYGEPGDRLWVRETWRSSLSDERTVHYAASLSEYDRKEKGPWRPSIFMPRWASRITLEVSEVRVQRLQSISEDDARAEGVERDAEPCDHTRISCDEIGCLGPTHRSTFCELWDSINGKRAPWSSNPWVWAIAFRRMP